MPRCQAGGRHETESGIAVLGLQGSLFILSVHVLGAVGATGVMAAPGASCVEVKPPVTVVRGVLFFCVQ